MESTKPFNEALMQQFQWVKIIFGRGKVYTKRQKIQAYLFAFMHFCFFLTLCGHSLLPMVSIMLTFLMQTVACGIAMISYVTLQEYADKMANAMELEQSQNPLMVASISVRLFCMLHALLAHSYFLFFFGLIELGYNVHVYRKYNLLIDATNVWKSVSRLQVDRGLRMAYNCFLIVVAVLNMIYIIIKD